MRRTICYLWSLLALLYCCNTRVGVECVPKRFEVTATAYNSLKYQTNSNPNITAFGDSLRPGLKYIAVSRDLLDSGLVHNKRWRKRIDIYMGNDVYKAKKWGKKKINIEYCVPVTDSID